MTWLKISDEFLEDDTVLELKDRGYRLHVSAMVYSSRNLTDGVISVRSIKVLEAILAYPLSKFVAELIDSGLWIPTVGGGYEIKNFLKYNPPASEVKARRDRDAARQRKHRADRAAEETQPTDTSMSRVTSAVTSPVSHAAPTRPDPEEEKPKAVTRPPGTALDTTNVRNLIDKSLKEAS